ncbi:DHHA1 domain-containing protein, partial [Bartonella apis]
EALRETLGTHVAQKGSLVTPERLRFDFSHPKPMTAEEIKQVEDLANEIVLQNSPVTTRLMSVDDAIAEGAMALFGEKYGDEVRVVSMGQRVDPTKVGNRAWSLELCGGTHVKRTGDIGLIRIVSESAVAAGVRRIEALTGDAARHYLDGQDQRVHEIANALKTTPQEALERVHVLVEERRKLEKELNEARKQLALSGGANDHGEADIEQINGLAFMGRVVHGIAPKDLKPLADAGKNKIGSGVVAFIGVSEDGKASAVVGVTDDLTKRFNAVELVKALSEVLGGKGGGGRPDMAQAGGPDGNKADDAMKALRQKLQK